MLLNIYADKHVIYLYNNTLNYRSDTDIDARLYFFLNFKLIEIVEYIRKFHRNTIIFNEIRNKAYVKFYNLRQSVFRLKF